MTTRKITDPSVPPKRDNYGVHCYSSALANLAASEDLPFDHPAQEVLLRRAQAYASLACAQFAPGS